MRIVMLIFFSLFFLTVAGYAADIYKEVDLIAGYSDRNNWIFEQPKGIRNSLGFEYFDQLSNDYGDFLTLDLQARVTYDFDCTLGPTQDGGYYLIGQSKLCASVFEGIDWSTGKVMDQTLNKMRICGLSYAILEELYDIDTEADIVDNLVDIKKIVKTA